MQPYSIIYYSNVS